MSLKTWAKRKAKNRKGVGVGQKNDKIKTGLSQKTRENGALLPKGLEIYVEKTFNISCCPETIKRALIDPTLASKRINFVLGAVNSSAHRQQNGKCNMVF